MKVACPHCNAAYNIDDGRIPATGLNVRCPKCRNAFPVKPADGPPVQAGAVPLPAPSAARDPAAVPLPAPEAPAFPEPPPPAAEAPADEAAAADAPAAPDPSVPSEDDSSPAFFAGAEASEPFPPAEPAAGAEEQFAAPEPPPPDEPLPVAPESETEPSTGGSASAAEALGFGEVDFGAPAAPGASDPFAAVAPAAGEPPPAEELEMLFGDGAAKPGSKGASGEYKVRRRSGKVFGPFDEAQVVAMLGKGELMGNEDVSADGGQVWTPIGAVPAFGGALRSLLAEPGESGTPAARQPQRAAPFGARMASTKLAKDEASPRRLVKRAIPAVAIVLLALAAGIAGGFTRYGFFFAKAFRRADSAQVAALAAQARAALAKNDYPSERSALDLAAQAVAADPVAGPPAALHVMTVGALEHRHGAPPEALDQARREADRLEKDEKGEVPALAARLALAVATAPGPATAAQESALEQAARKSPPDAELVALLARAALARGDLARAGALYGNLEALEPGGPRPAHGQGLVAAARRDAAGAKAAFEKALAKAPEHLASRLELAELADAAGDAPGAQAQLAPLLADGAPAKLGPAERARALALRAAILARSTATGAEADKSYEAAIQADGRFLGARVALARHRLRRGDAAGAVAALDPVAQLAVATPALAAVRIRALAAAGRALDASSLAQAALQKTPGDPALLLARAVALQASGKAEEAAALYRDAAARDPGAFEPRLALGRIALAQKDLARAAADIGAAVEKGPREPGVQAALGELLVAQGRPAEAEAAFRAALALDPEHSPAEVGLARLALSRGDVAGARARLERALASDPRNAEGYVAYGTILWSARELPAAEKAFQAAVGLAPLHPVALARLGAVKLERDDLDGAVQQLSAASNEDPKLPEARRWLGRALLRKNETPGAIAQLRRAIELEPGNRENHFHLGMALERSGALAEAIEAHRAATALDPKYVDAWERIGVVYAANGRFDGAIPAYERAIAAAPRLTRLKLALGDCKVKLGKHGEAVKIFREVLKTDPSAVEALYRLARALHESEGARTAQPFYERATREEPKNPMAHYYLGYLYKEQNQKARAVQEFKRYLELRPDAEDKKDIEIEIEDLGGAHAKR